MEREILTVMQACTRAGVSRRTIYNWIRDDKVKYIRTASGAIRIFADTLWKDGNQTVQSVRSVRSA